MGIGVQVEMLRQDKTPEYLLQDPYKTELQRITLNIQINLIHSIGKQAAEYAEKTGQAEVELMGRLQQGQTRPDSVSMQPCRSTFDETITNGEVT